MKKLFLAIAIATTLFSCSNENDYENVTGMAKEDQSGNNPAPYSPHNNIIETGWQPCPGNPVFGVGASGQTIYTDGQGHYAWYLWNRTTPYNAVQSMGIGAGSGYDTIWGGLYFWQSGWTTSC